MALKRGGDATSSIEKNTCIGYESGENLDGGWENTFIGHSAGEGMTSGDGNVFIGRNAGAAETSTSNQFFIENSNTTTPLLWGEFSLNYVNINGNLGINTETPSFDLSFSEGSAQTIGVEDEASGGGNNLTISSGTAEASSTNQKGGDLYLTTGGNTGSGGGVTAIYFQIPNIEASGTTNNAVYTAGTLTAAAEDKTIFTVAPHNFAATGDYGELNLGGGGVGVDGNIIRGEHTNGFLFYTDGSLHEFQGASIYVNGGSARFGGIGSGASAGALHYTSDGTLTTNTSDKRLKENIVTLTDSVLEKINALVPVKFDWKDTTLTKSVVIKDADGKNKNINKKTYEVSKADQAANKKQYGFIAQDLQVIMPELVNINKVDGFYNVNEQDLIPYLVKYVQLLEARIKTLEGN